MKPRRAGIVTITALCVSLFPCLVPAQSCTEPPATQPLPDVALQQVASGFDQPVHITHAGDGSGRLFVVEQDGVIRIIDHGKVLPEPLLDIRDKVKAGGEKGLLSVAFHPRFRDNGLFYVNYTSQTGILAAIRSGFDEPRGALYTIVARYRVTSANRAGSDSETVLLKIAQPFANHNGGQLAFGPDGYLYVGMGDGGSANDPFNHGQNLSTLLGAILRIDVDHEQAPNHYAIPADNPFTDVETARGEIWAYGVRNPWRFSFDRGSGRLFAADVGQDVVEEIDIVRQGGNYGWRVMEGDICTPGVNSTCDASGLEKPLFSYRHPDGFSVTGGFVYRGSAIPELCGAYLYADYVTRRLWALRVDGDRVTVHREIAMTDENISSFGEDESGELYVVGHQSGRIVKIGAATAPGE